jgi:hypothetical protein
MNNITKYFFIFTTILSTIFIILLFVIFIVKDKNIEVQPFLYKIYNKIKNYKKSNLLNPNYSLTKQDSIIILDNFLNKDYFRKIKKIFNNTKYDSKKINILLTKRSGTGLDFFELHKQPKYNQLLELYYSPHLIEELSKILKKPVQRVSLADPNACSLLIYSNKGDNIGWHKDASNYYGDRYVCLLTIINENDKKDDLSANTFQYNHYGTINKLKMKENSMLIFKGSEILHQSTAIDDNEKRILLSMVFCDTCQEKKHIFNYYYEEIKKRILYEYKQ